MEKLRKVVNEIAYTNNLNKLSPLHLSLLPFLSISSAFYKLALSLRHFLYKHRFFQFQIHHLPVPVISVGNLTWGGNGKTPMVEFIALYFSHCGISPLVLSRVIFFLLSILNLASILFISVLVNFIFNSEIFKK
jgi:tetraacyldisaccharide 4'-kinase